MTAEAEAGSPPARLRWVTAVLITARPRQWPKNLLVFAAPLAAATLGRDDGLGYALVAAAAFGCASVAVYLANDVADAERDRRHPRKRHRPVAAGDLPKLHAIMLSAVSASAGITAGVVISEPLLTASVGGYLGISFLYSGLLKHIPVLELCFVASGFLLRVQVSASVTFTELLACVVPLGLLPPVLPGTRHLTVGGAVAADVHGKNQHGDGSISAWLEAIELLDGGGALRAVRPGSPAFRATVGGMALTGVIVSVRLRLLRIRSARLQVTTRRLGDLDALLAAQDEPRARYAVSWVDLSATGRSLGRGVLDTGDHLTSPDPVHEADGLHYHPGRPWPAPALPFCPVTTRSARAFNQLWFRASPQGRTSVAGIPAYFHRLDAVRDWNRTLGPGRTCAAC